MLDILTIHHVSLPVSDIVRAKRFYSDVLGLQEIPRPAFPFDGAWYQLGDRHLHLIKGTNSTLRDGKPIDSHDIHFAIRVRSYRAALDYLTSKGYRADVADADPLKLRANPTGTAGFPQIYILDPDRNVVELNAEALD
jgi:catechol 2,3-dioxygenase-like lactoylglutathione lyase family enzyme